MDISWTDYAGGKIKKYYLELTRKRKSYVK